MHILSVVIRRESILHVLRMASVDLIVDACLTYAHVLVALAQDCTRVLVSVHTMSMHIRCL